MQNSESSYSSADLPQESDSINRIDVRRNVPPDSYQHRVLRLYLNEVGPMPIFTRAGELFYANIIAHSRKTVLREASRQSVIATYVVELMERLPAEPDLVYVLMDLDSVDDADILRENAGAEKSTKAQRAQKATADLVEAITAIKTNLSKAAKYKRKQSKKNWRPMARMCVRVSRLICSQPWSPAQVKHFVGLIISQVSRKKTSTPALKLACKRIKNAEKRGKEAERIFVSANLKLVLWAANKYVDRGLDYDDLICEGNFGLLKAVTKFKPELGFGFANYALGWIRRDIKCAIGYHSGNIRFSSETYLLLTKISAAKALLPIKYGRRPTFEEIAKHLKISGPEVVLALQRSKAQPISLELVVGEDGESTLKDVIPDPFAVSPLEVTEHKSQWDNLSPFIKRLSTKEQIVIKRRFGLNELGKEETLQEIADSYGITREAIRQTEERALNKLRQWSLGEQS